MKNPIFIAHRGFRVGVVENTYQAFDKAVSIGMDYIEFDVHLSSDGVLVVIHDNSVDRVYSGSGLVSKLTVDELTGLKSKENEQSIPRLEDVLSSYSGKIKFMIELKGYGTGAPAAEMVKDKNLVGDVVFSSRDITNLEDAIKSLSPTSVKSCLNITNCKDFTTEQFLKTSSIQEMPLPFSMISLRSNLVEKDFIKKCHDLGILALCWDFLSPKNPMKLARKLHNMGIDGFLFDDPEMTLKFKEKSG